jgi:hypothetical protein
MQSSVPPLMRGALHYFEKGSGEFNQPDKPRRTALKSLLDMKILAPLLLILSIVPASTIPRNAQVVSSGKAWNGADRTITWRPWQQKAKDEFRFRTGDRYLGRAVWEHYLGFEQFRTSSKAIKLSMIRLGNEDVPEEVVIRPGSRYAIFKVTNGSMTANKGVWSWTAQEIQ